MWDKTRLRVCISLLIGLAWLAALYVARWGVPLYSYAINPKDIAHEQESAYTAKLPVPKFSTLLTRESDSMEQPRISQARLYEDSRLIGVAHAGHDVIRRSGNGAYSDWSGYLYFSSSDNSDPRQNGRRYELRDVLYLVPQASRWIGGCALFILIAIWALPTAARISASYKANEVATKVAAGRAGLFASVAILGIAVMLHTRGAALWAAVCVGIVFLLLAVRQGLMVLFLGRRNFAPLKDLAMIMASAGLIVVAFEGVLWWLEAAALTSRDVSASAETRQGSSDSESSGTRFELPVSLLEEMESRKHLLSLPAKWQLRRIDVPGTKWAYTWHGVDHIFDDDNFRRYSGPFPAKRPNVMRIIVVGDSMTYGAGIDSQWTYTAQLERAMQKRYRVEFFNLGVNGHQSEDVARVVERFVPELKADLIIYGVCYNDFLPSGVGQYDKDVNFPLPAWLKDWLLARTRIAHFFRDGYVRLLLALGISLDFYDDILKDFNGYQERFARDVRRMNDVARFHGLQPVVGMTLDQNLDRRGQEISQIAERLMREAGFTVVPMDSYYGKHSGERLTVSTWEAHPNERANAIFAQMLYDALEAMPEVQTHALRETSIVHGQRR